MLTEEQRGIFFFLRHYIFKHHTSPTEKEIAKETHITSLRTVRHHLLKIANANLIFITGEKRGIRLLNANQYMQLPVIDFTANKNRGGLLKKISALDLADLMVGANRFVFQVKGNSLRRDHIHDGDYLIYEKRDVIKEHEIALMVINNTHIVLKRIKYEDNAIALLSSNPCAKPMIYSTEKISIQGVYLGLIRGIAQIRASNAI